MGAYETAGKDDDWQTPAYIFEALGEHFDLDVAAPIGDPRHIPCSSYYSENALKHEWKGFVWMNPPFGHQRQKIEWLTKFFEHGNGIALLPDRTSAPWFQQFAPLADLVIFLSPKVKFERPDGTIGESPGTGTVLLAAGPRAAAAIARAHSLGIIASFYSPGAAMRPIGEAA